MVNELATRCLSNLRYGVAWAVYLSALAPGREHERATIEALSGIESEPTAAMAE